MGSTDHERVEMSSSWSPWMVETEGADQFELEDLDGSPHAFAHGSSMTTQMVAVLVFDS